MTATLTGTAPTDSAAPTTCDKPPGVWRLRHAAVCAVLVALSFSSSPGLISPDTKIDLTEDPAAFLSRGLHLWDAHGFAGQVQNQAYGYLFPMGPFFWLTHTLGVSGWAAQRLWWAALLCTAFLGVVSLTRALRLGTPFSRLLAGCAFAGTPRILTLLGANSVESLPMCVAPWIVLALVKGSAEWTPRRAGLMCGMAVLFMGGVNAAADLAAVLPAIVYLVFGPPGTPRMRLAGWAVLAALLATAWWTIPLLLLGKYSPPFLDWIENAATTTGVTALPQVLRGTSDWIAYLPSSGWQAGLSLLTDPLLVVATVAVAGAGLAGLAATSRHRRWLIACLGLGVVLVCFGHSAPIGSFGAVAEQHLLDSMLAPIRNVHKFDVLLRLPLVLGLAGVVPRLRFGSTTIERQRSGAVLKALAVAAVAVAALPMFTFQLANTNSYTSVPQYWQQAADWLGDRGGTGRALLVPASPTPTYLWGTPTDEPIQALASSDWDVRNNVPLTPAGHIRVLDAIDNLLATGASQAALPTYLARAGVSYLVVRNDLDYTRTGSLPPAVVHATLASTTGLTQVAGFGPVIGTAGDYSVSIDQGLQATRPAVEIWHVGSGESDPRVTATPLQSVTQVSGAPESALQLQQDGVDTPATVLTGQTGDLDLARVALTDGLRRREVNYGGASGQHSVTLTADDDGVVGRSVMDYLPVTGEQHQSVARYLGAKSVTASSSAADPSGFFPVRPDEQPYAAFDDDPTTSWRPAPGTDPSGQWIQVELLRPTPINAVTVRVSLPTSIHSLTVSTSAGSHTYPVPPDGEVHASTADGGASVVRVGIAAVQPGSAAPAGIAAISADSLTVTRTVVLPDDTPTDRPVDVLDFATPGDGRTGCILVASEPQCIAGRARTSEDGSSLNRLFDLRQSGSYTVGVTVTPRPGNALDALLRQVASPAVTATASSQAVPDPLAGPQSLVDGDAGTGWVASPEDPDPTVTLRWKTPETFDHLTFVTSPGFAATRPDLVRIVVPGGTRNTIIGRNGVAHFAPVTTDQITLHLGTSISTLRPVYPSTVADESRVGIGLMDLDIPGVSVTSRDSTDGRAVLLPCGEGPTVTVGGLTVQTSIETTVAAVRDLQPVRATICDPTPGILVAGPHHLVAHATPVWNVVSTVLTRDGAQRPTSASPDVRVTTWSPTSRVVDVAARTAPVVVTAQENTNAGWRATWNGEALTSVTVDGWRQGYLLPAGAAATVRLNYVPQRTYAVGLVAGLAGALVVVLFALLVSVRDRRRRTVMEPSVASGSAAWAGVAFALVTCTAVGSLPGLLVAVTTTVAIMMLGRLIRDDRRVMVAVAALAFSCVVVAGAFLAVNPFLSLGYAPDNGLAQMLCLVAIAAVMSARIPTPRRPAEPA